MSKENQQQKSVSIAKLRYPIMQKFVPQCRKKQKGKGCLTAIIVVVVIGLIGSCFVEEKRGLNYF